MNSQDRYDTLIAALRAAGIQARLEGAAMGAAMILARRGDREIRITDTDPPLPENPQDLTGWWVGVYGLDTEGEPLADGPEQEKDFAPEDIAGLVAWTTSHSSRQ
ncbi:hypothetical protein [Streptomyces phytophilus]|uniref:hypothetical protein n=1 Tax=Streptomyces phytophilus TaxID=722715 RepID=UPI0015F04EA4|nr:hypothetical protein [Streptomyces phytophilus]